MAAFLFGLAWGMLTLFFLLLVGIGARPIPVPPEPGSPKPSGLSLYRLRFCLGDTGTWTEESTSGMSPSERLT